MFLKKTAKCHLCGKSFKLTINRIYCSYDCRSKAKAYRYGLKELFKLSAEDQEEYHEFRKKEGLE